MEPSLPPIPTDLWPKVRPVTATRPEGCPLTLEVFFLSARPLLSALSRAVHFEMQGAGKWAARSGSPLDKSLPSSQDFSRLHADDAARLLAIYTALHAAREHPSALDLSPEDLKASASRSYAKAFQLEQRSQQNASASYNDGLYRQTQEKQQRQGANLHP